MGKDFAKVSNKTWKILGRSDEEEMRFLIGRMMRAMLTRRRGEVWSWEGQVCGEGALGRGTWSQGLGCCRKALKGEKCGEALAR